MEEASEVIGNKFVNPWEERQEIGLWNALIQTIKAVLFKPGMFFSSVSLEESYGSLFLFYFILSFLLIIVWQIQAFFLTNVLSPFLHTHPQPANVRFMASVLTASFQMAGLVLIFVVAALMHLLVLLCGGKGGYKGTFVILVYCFSAEALTIVPLLGPLASMVWGFVIWNIAFKRVHQISIVRVWILNILIIALTLTAVLYFRKPENSKLLNLNKMKITVQQIAIPVHPNNAPTVPSRSSTVRPYKVEGLLYSRNQRGVLIDGNSYGLNEKVAGGQIIDIASDAITVQFKDKKTSYRVGENITVPDK